MEGRSELTVSEIVNITKELGDLDWKILSEIKAEPKSSVQLADLFNVSSRTIKEHYISLKNIGLIETKTGSGVCLSVKGIKLVRWGLHSNSEMGKENFTNTSNGETKLHHFTSKKRRVQDEKVNQFKNTERNL